MSTMRLQPVGLTEADVTRLEVFLRFIGKRARWQWVLVRDGAADLLICAAGARRSVPSDPASEVAVLSGPGQPPQHALDRDIALPSNLDLETFQELLTKVEARMAIAAASTVAAPSPPMPVVQAVPQRSAIATLEGRFRLIRWPGAELLRSHPKAVRLLGFIAREAISMDRLETLSGLDRAACTEIVQQLLRRDLLAWHATASAPPSMRLASKQAPATEGARSRTTAPGELSAGLLTRLRMKLGFS